MKSIYNKILKEALDIMDFDSWDDSEQVFKNNIENSLKNNIFVYYRGNKNYIQIFEKPGSWCYKWPSWNGDNENSFKNTEAYIEGIAFPLNKGSKTIQIQSAELPTTDKNGYIKVTLKFPRKLIDEDCVNMFAESDVAKVPALNVSECTSLKYMFVACKYLETVEPFMGLDNITDAWGMFACGGDCCPMLDNKTISFWQPAGYHDAIVGVHGSLSRGTPKRWNSPEFFHE